MYRDGVVSAILILVLQLNHPFIGKHKEKRNLLKN